jgi:hypothetical protein
MLGILTFGNTNMQSLFYHVGPHTNVQQWNVCVCVPPSAPKNKRPGIQESLRPVGDNEVVIGK